MKITQTATTVIAEAETIAEALQLLALVNPAIPTSPNKQTRGPYKTKAKCPQCGKKFSNLPNHIEKKHTNPVDMTRVRAGKDIKKVTNYLHDNE